MKDKQKKPKKSVEKASCNKPSKNDPLGSYTGVPANKKERPTQDADDL